MVESVAYSVCASLIGLDSGGGAVPYVVRWTEGGLRRADRPAAEFSRRLYCTSVLSRHTFVRDTRDLALSQLASARGPG